MTSRHKTNGPLSPASPGGAPREAKSELRLPESGPNQSRPNQTATQESSFSQVSPSQSGTHGPGLLDSGQLNLGTNPLAGEGREAKTHSLQPKAPLEAFLESQVRPSLVLDNLRTSDIPRIMKLEKLCFVDQWTADNFIQELSRGFTLAKGLFLDNALKAMYLSWLLPPECHLLNLMVHPTLWGRGWGQYLMADLIESAKNNKAYTIILEVRVGNARAEALYKKLGFVATGLRRSYYSDGSNAVTMTLELPAPPDAPKVATIRRIPATPPKLKS